MNAYVWKVGPIFTLRSGRYTGTPGQTFVLKELETDKEYKLNLPLEWHGASTWLRDLKEGNVFYGLGVAEMSRNSVAWWIPYSRVEVKNVNKEETV